MGRAISWPASRSEIIECIMKDSLADSLTESLNENFRTFKSWTDRPPGKSHESLLKRFMANFGTFFNWSGK